ncbi:MAG: Twin-arginine protein secretion pathway component TatC [Thermodesulfobacterium sp.]|uniref:Sec-independent protein translocase protein TatC n=1 Tax=Candidatus Thermodesulfobacterium syntrophicum TaxID=3060442 RepID=A0AAE3TF43_9BACT|nr:Twin-arginine protein secretion pathway component TatC [Candidatus Thermodesulfobacterium syntrophicum]
MHELTEEYKKQTLVDHLIELRSCLIKSFIGWVVGAVISYLLAEHIINLLLLPLYKVVPLQSKVFFRIFPEVFLVYIKLSIIVGFIISSPYIFYQIWLFIAPGLYPHEKKWVKSVVFLTCFSFLIGDLLAYYIFLPAILKFLYSFGEKFLIFKPFLKEYISFVLKIFIIFGVLFQIPSSLFLLSKLDLVTSSQLKSFRPYAVILAFLIAAILTSGVDPLNQLLLAIPLTLLYEVGIILVKLSEFKKGG